MTCVIFYDNTAKIYWDLFLAALLLATSFVTPFRLAFYDKDELGWVIANHVIDAIFFVDIIFSFLTTYVDDLNFHVKNKKMIARKYLSGWFTIDFLAVAPFDSIMSQVDGLNNIVRTLRIGRLYKLIKLTKIMRVLKLANSNNINPGS